MNILPNICVHTFGKDIRPATSPTKQGGATAVGLVERRM
jgi:hypothetical protein